MLDTAQVRDAANLPAITHVDGSARVQTVAKEVDPRFHELLSEFGRITGYPILLNTSFNLRGEPIVCDPGDALLCFVRSRLDALVMGDLMLLREGIPSMWLAVAEAAGPPPERAISGDYYTFI
jgi:carbamoyltransferase